MTIMIGRRETDRRKSVYHPCLGSFSTGYLEYFHISCLRLVRTSNRNVFAISETGPSSINARTHRDDLVAYRCQKNSSFSISD